MKTEREFLNRVYELVTDEEVLAYIDSRLEKLDAVNERQREQRTQRKMKFVLTSARKSLNGTTKPILC